MDTGQPQEMYTVDTEQLSEERVVETGQPQGVDSVDTQSTLVLLDVTTEHLTPLQSWLESLICLHGECWRQDF